MRDYYLLTKPGIIRGNLIVAVAGYFLASDGIFNWSVLAGVVLGLGLIIASACVANNIIDRHIDRQMGRTKGRALAAGRVSVASAALYATALGILGVSLLFVLTNLLAVVLAVTGWIAYVWVYGWGKRRTVHGTVIGSVSGAIPPVVGYVAVSNQLDAAALLLFTILVTWQMPHFYAIAMYRSKDYAAASIPVLPVARSRTETKWQIIFYVIAFGSASTLLTFLGYTGIVYLVLMLVVSAAWLALSLKGISLKDDDKWAKGVFMFSLIALLVFSIGISIDTFLP